MKHLLLSFTAFFLLITQSGRCGDVVIVSLYQNQSPFYFDELFEFVVHSNETAPIQGQIFLTLEEVETRQPIAKCVAPGVTITTGANSFLKHQFSVEQFSNNLSEDFFNRTFLSEGRFQICITVLTSVGEFPAKNCFELNLTGQQIIDLLSPLRGERIKTLNPFLQWYSTFDDERTTYRLLLSPMEDYSSPEKALDYNVKYLNMELTDRNYFYSFDALQLEYGKKYAWQVFALQKGRVVARSQAWYFIPVEDDPKDKDQVDGYRLIHKRANNGNYRFGEIVRFGYFNADNSTGLVYKVMDLTTGKQLSSLPSIKLRPGLNKIDIAVKDLKGIKSEHHYCLEVTNSRNECYKFHFQASR